MDLIREAGWGIWPVLGFGGWAVITALMEATAPREGRMRTLAYLLALTTLSGIFGTVLGIQVSAEHIGEVRPDERWIFLLGLKESLQNMVAALSLDGICLLLLLGRHLRSQRSVAPSVARVGSMV
jgi:hypothetical protein